MEAESANSYTVEVTAATFTGRRIMGYMAPRAVFVTHQSQECMGVLTDTTVMYTCRISIPLSTKRVVAANQFKRALEASTSNGQDRGTDKIHQLLLNNDYPPDEIERALMS